MRRLQPRRSRDQWDDPTLPNRIRANRRMEFGAKGRSAARSACANDVRGTGVVST